MPLCQKAFVYFFSNIFRNKNTIEFELKNFNNSFNQDKEIALVYSPKYKFGEYNWSISSQVEKYPRNNELWFLIYLRCESDNKSNFPVFANMTYSILNKDKDSRKIHSKSNRLTYYSKRIFFKNLNYLFYLLVSSFCYKETFGWGYWMLSMKVSINKLIDNMHSILEW